MDDIDIIEQYQKNGFDYIKFSIKALDAFITHKGKWILRLLGVERDTMYCQVVEKHFVYQNTGDKPTNEYTYTVVIIDYL